MVAVSASAEDGEAGTILFAFAYPGTCGWGPTEADARKRLRADLRFALDWLDAHGLDHLAPRGGLDVDRVDIEVAERVRATGDPLQCDSEGFFEVDRRPYAGADVSRTVALLAASRRDLLDAVADLSSRTLDQRLVEGRRTVREVLDHVAIAEHWYLTRVDVPVDVPDGWRGYPDDTFERLTETRADVERVLAALPEVPAERRSLTWDADGERWTVLKVLRRLVWHELLHYKQLVRLVPKVEAAVEERGDSARTG